MKEIVLATGNLGKVREINELLAGTGIHVQPQSQFGVLEAEETGLTFVENALIKARNAVLHTGLPAIADDSGLEVDALNGAPGIYSSRYAGPAATDRDNVEKLLASLADVSDAQRGARFQCVMVYLRHAAAATPLICHSSWEGRIVFAPRGCFGFGFVPVFFVFCCVCLSVVLLFVFLFVFFFFL